MFRSLVLMALVLGFQNQTVTATKQDATQDTPQYTATGDLKLPEHYREWIYLTSGIDMSYSASQTAGSHSMFDNVFVNPTSYRSFLANGTWPDRTTLVLEIRGAEGPSSINQRGHSQSPEVMGLEVHVKDASLPGGWGFFEFDGKPTASLVKRPASCYTCHQQHGAVDTTFVQFYPTLIGLAKSKNTLSPEYLQESKTAAK